MKADETKKRKDIMPMLCAYLPSLFVNVPKPSAVRRKTRLVSVLRRAFKMTIGIVWARLRRPVLLNSAYSWAAIAHSTSDRTISTEMKL